MSEEREDVILEYGNECYSVGFGVTGKVCKGC